MKCEKYTFTIAKTAKDPKRWGWWAYSKSFSIVFESFPTRPSAKKHMKEIMGLLTRRSR